MSTLEHPLIDRFLDALWLEKGLADNTREAYRNDLQQFNAWLDGRGLRLEGIGRDAILDHLAWRLEQGYKARSTARFLSGLRGFYRYCLRDGLIAEDPTLQVDLPQLGKPLPKSLSEADVEALLAAPEVDDPLGLRDRTMLEVLYACGLRVSELVGLTLEQVNLRQGVVKVFGKGSKERLVPLGEEAIGWLERYLREARGDLLGGRPSDVLFPSLRGEQMTRQTFLASHQASRAGGGDRHVDFAAHPAPRLRHPPAQPWRRPAGGADAARPQRPVDHPDLYPYRPGPPPGSARTPPPARLTLCPKSPYLSEKRRFRSVLRQASGPSG